MPYERADLLSLFPVDGEGGNDVRSVNQGAGEVTDRLSILALKIAHGQAAGQDVGHFVSERNALLVQLRARTSDPCLEQTFELATTNAMLWYAEDAIRRLREDAEGASASEKPTLYMEAGRIGMRVQQLNDRRAELVGEINRSSGEFYGPEKVTGGQ